MAVATLRVDRFDQGGPSVRDFRGKVALVMIGQACVSFQTACEEKTSLLASLVEILLAMRKRRQPKVTQNVMICFYNR